MVRTTILSDTCTYPKEMGNLILSGRKQRNQKLTPKRQAGSGDIVETKTGTENDNAFLYCQDAM